MRALEEKPSDKLLSGIRLRALVAAAKQTGASISYVFNALEEGCAGEGEEEVGHIAAP